MEDLTSPTQILLSAGYVYWRISEVDETDIFIVLETEALTFQHLS